MTKTTPEVFIVESLRLEDEEQKLQEGKILANMLHISGKTETKYYYIRTLKELKKIANLFGDSKYKYLHISCHADSKGLATTFDNISYSQLGNILKQHIDNRRVFVSACKMANSTLATQLLPHTQCYSLIGPRTNIYFDDAAAFWVSFYHLMFKQNDQEMKFVDLKKNIFRLSELFQQKIYMYRKRTSESKGFKTYKSA